MQGDRVSICVIRIDSALLEHDFECAPSCLTPMQLFIMPANLIKYFKLPALSKQKFHFTIGHSTVVVAFCSSRRRWALLLQLSAPSICACSLYNPTPTES
jgi:hypothetical protein